METHTVEESTRLGRAIKALGSFSPTVTLSNEKRQKLRALTSMK